MRAISRECHLLDYLVGARRHNGSWLAHVMPATARRCADVRKFAECLNPNRDFKYKLELYLQRQTDRKSYMTYRVVPFSITLNDPNPDFKGTRYYSTLNI